MEKSLNFNKLTLGVCYYPEHWDKSLWDDDLKRMKKHGLEVIRIAEFAWSMFEKTENNFCFDFFDEFLKLTLKYNIKVIFCTPTATPPAWLTYKYPDCLNANINGTLYNHGQRRHYNYNSKIYRQLCSRIVEKIAEHYCSHPSIIGWQIDNEFNCEMDTFHSDADQIAFREFLKKKYTTLDNLNNAWGTVFWNQTYTDWEEVFLSRLTPSSTPNQHLLLDEKEFISESCISFCKMQSDIINKYLPQGKFITTNGLFGHLDSHKLTDICLDFFCYDNYPNFSYEIGNDLSNKDDIKDRWASFKLAKTRSISPIFGIMEQQSNGGGWVNKMLQSSPKPGQMRLWALQSVASGADFVSFFRFRTCTAGTEIYWHGLIDYSNSHNRRLDELDTLYSDIQKIQGVCGMHYKADAAIMKDYPNEWDSEFDKWLNPLANQSTNNWFNAFQHHHIPVDLFQLRDNTTYENISKYKIIVYPHPAIMTEATALLLKEYVQNGGTLIIGGCSGFKDANGKCYMLDRPGYLKELLGARVSDFTLLNNHEMQSSTWDNQKIDVLKYVDILETTSNDTTVLATYDNDYYEKLPALVSRKVGLGQVIYYGSMFTEKTAETFLNRLEIKPIRNSLLELPRELEIAIRGNSEKEYLFIMNYMPYDVKFKLHKPMLNLLTGDFLVGEATIEKYGVIVLEHLSCQ